MAAENIYLENDQLDAVSYYDKIKPQYDELVNKKLAEINKIGGVNVEQNRTKVKQIKKIQNAISRHNIIKSVCITFLIIAALALCFIGFEVFNKNGSQQIMFICIAIALLILIIFLIIVLASKKRKENFLNNKKNLDSLISECAAEMKKMLDTIDPFIIPEMIQKIYPSFNFERTTRLDSDWDGKQLSLDAENCCVQYISGTLDKSPFFCGKIKNMTMVMKVYTGQRISVNSRGVRSNTTQTYSHPAPIYKNDNYFFFLNDSAKTLTYSNVKKVFNFKKKQLPMENNEFDKYFPCLRNDEIQFRLLYSVLAQENIVKLFKKNPYFAVTKEGNVTKISNRDFDTNLWANKDSFSTYDYDEFNKNFIDFSNQIFQNIYMLAAPIICIPVYQKFSYKTKVNKIGKIPGIPHVMMVINNFFNKANIVHDSTTTDYIIEAACAVKKTYGIYHITTNSFIGINKTIYINGANIRYVDYKPLTKNTTLLAIPLSKNINERKITDVELTKIKTTIKKAVAAVIYADFLYILSEDSPKNFTQAMASKIIMGLN